MNETGVLGSWGGGQECLCQRGCRKPVQVVGTESTHSERTGVHGNPPLEQHGGLPASLGQASGGGRPIPLGGEFPSGSSSFSRN